MSVEDAKRACFGIVRKDTSGFGLELLLRSAPGEGPELPEPPVITADVEVLA